MHSVHFILFNLYLSCWLGVYYLIFSRKITFKTNRFLLLGGIIIAGILPFLSFSFLHSPVPATSSVTSIGIGTATVLPTSAAENTPSFPLWYVLIGVYWVGVLITGTLFMIRWIRIHHFAKKFSQQKQKGYVHVLLPEKSEIFSFGKYLFAPKDISESILEHEKVHIFQKHSLDNLFLEIIKVFCWFNPAIYSYQKALKMVHEYLADQAATNKVYLSDYAEKLVSQSFAISTTSLVHPFLHSSNLQKRLTMLKKKGQAKKHLWTYILIAPFLLGILFVVSSFTIKDKLAHTVTNIQPHEQHFSHAVKQQSKITTKTGLSNSAHRTTDTTDQRVFQFVEDMPQFPGGQSALMKYLSQHIHYPQKAKKDSIQGTIVGQFVVEKDGSISNVKTVGKRKGDSLEEEVIRVIKAMPKWLPGKQNGKKVRVQYSLPVRFTFPKQTQNTNSIPSSSSASATKNRPATPASNGKAHFDSSKPYTFVEDMPQFPGGKDSLIKYLSAHIKYPKKAREHVIQGTVVVQFIVNKDGAISQTKARSKKLGYGLEQEAVRVVKEMPNWVPGEQDGKRVAVQYSLPIRFSLQ